MQLNHFLNFCCRGKKILWTYTWLSFEKIWRLFYLYFFGFICGANTSYEKFQIFDIAVYICTKALESETAVSSLISGAELWHLGILCFETHMYCFASRPGQMILSKKLLSEFFKTRWPQFQLFIRPQRMVHFHSYCILPPLRVY